MDWKIFVAAPLAALVFVAGAQDLTPPRDWSFGSTGRSSGTYAIGVDPNVSHGGQRSLSVQSREPAATIDHGAAIQYAYGYQGRRVRVSAWLRTAQVKGWAGLFLRVKDDSTEDFFGSRRPELTESQLPFGVGDGGVSDGPWRPVSIVAEVPDRPGASVAIGLIVLGEGQAWISGLHFEEVGRETRLTQTRIGMDLAAYAEAKKARAASYQRHLAAGPKAPQPPKNLALE